MAIYLDICNLIIDKKAIIERYNGGLERFREKYDIPASEINQEDAHLFSLGQMNADEYDIDELVKNGLSFKRESQHSDDFTIVYRYGDADWEVDWLRYNKVFAWHIHSDSKELQLVDEISNMRVARIAELIDEGKNPLKTIWIRDR